MAVTVTGRPEVTIEGGFVSRWVSASHPINFLLLGEPYDEEARPNYGIVVEVYEYGTETLLGRTKRLRPYPGSPVQVNVAGYLSNYIKVSATNMPKRGDVNKKDEGKAIQFYIQYKDVWDGNEGTFIKDNFTYHAAAIKAQIGDKYGSNLAQYLPVKGDVGMKNKAKYLTTFKNPVYFRGYDFFSLSFIYPAEFNNVDLQFIENRKTGDGDEFAPIYRQFDKTQINGINRLKMQGDYPPDVKTIGANTRTGQTADTNYYVAGYINAGFID